MPDVYHRITEADETIVEQLAAAMELRATEPAQQAMLAAYLDDAGLPDGARILEIGCGTGAISRALATRPGVAEVVGVDPSPGLIARAERLAADHANVSYRRGDGRRLPVEPGEFDAVVLHTVLSHAPEPAVMLAEARRSLRPDGPIAIFDGDYSTMTVAIGPHDPLQMCAEAFRDAYVHDPWIVRRLPSMLAEAGFEQIRLRSHGYTQTSDANYMLSVIDRGAAALAGAGRVSEALVEALKAEARDRVQSGSFFGHIAYASLIARKAS